MLGGVVPAGGPVVAGTVSYAVPDVGWEELKCPVCHWQFKTNYSCEGTWTSTGGLGTPALLATSLCHPTKC